MPQNFRHFAREGRQAAARSRPARVATRDLVLFLLHRIGAVVARRRSVLRALHATPVLRVGVLVRAQTSARNGAHFAVEQPRLVRGGRVVRVGLLSVFLSVVAVPRKRVLCTGAQVGRIERAIQLASLSSHPAAGTRTVAGRKRADTTHRLIFGFGRAKLHPAGRRPALRHGGISCASLRHLRHREVGRVPPPVVPVAHVYHVGRADPVQTLLGAARVREFLRGDVFSHAVAPTLPVETRRIVGAVHRRKLGQGRLARHRGLAVQTLALAVAGVRNPRQKVRVGAKL